MSFRTKQLNIVTKSDQRFYPALKALIGSLSRSSIQSRINSILILDFGLNEIAIRELKIVVGCIGAQLIIKKVSDVVYSPRLSEQEWYSDAIYGFLYKEAFSDGDDNDIVLAIDTDVTVLEEDAFDFEVEDDAFYACPDYPSLDLNFQLSGDSDDIYAPEFISSIDLTRVAFNAGVMLATRRVFKKVRLKTDDFKAAIENFYTNDQCALNFAVALLPNVQLRLLPQTFNWRPKFNRADKVDRYSVSVCETDRLSVYSSLFGRVKLCHFCGRPKPWLDKSSNGFKIWSLNHDTFRDIITSS